MLPNSRTLGPGFLAAAALIVLAGCGDRAPPRYHVKGTVTYDGKPLPAGVIYFDPYPMKKNDGPQGFAHVKDGRFDTRDGGRPCAGGPMIVRIEGFDGKPAAELPVGNVLFRNHEEKVELPREDCERDFTVPAAKGKK
jgi:hypothetical protein